MLRVVLSPEAWASHHILPYTLERSDLFIESLPSLRFLGPITRGVQDAADTRQSVTSTYATFHLLGVIDVSVWYQRKSLVQNSTRATILLVFRSARYRLTASNNRAKRDCSAAAIPSFSTES